jgi:hypothetical protein
MQRVRKETELSKHTPLTSCFMCRANKTGKIIIGNTKVFIADEDILML